MVGKIPLRSNGSARGLNSRAQTAYRKTARRSFLAAVLPALLAGSEGIAQESLPHDAYLRSEADRSAFLRWFTFLAEAQYFTTADQRPREIVDCSSLLRYAYREALRRHDSAWASQIRLPLIPAIPSVSQYNFPRTPTGPNLFRIGPEKYGQFADAETLVRYNTTLVNRDLLSSHPGDLLFYRHASAEQPFHSMIVLGKSQITGSPQHFVVYDTGSEGTSGGEIKRLSFDELLRFPDPRWHPISRNPAFLGVYRWNIVFD